GRGPVAGLAPADHDARAIGAVGPAAGQGQDVERAVRRGDLGVDRLAHEAVAGLGGQEVITPGRAGARQVGGVEDGARNRLAGAERQQGDGQQHQDEKTKAAHGRWAPARLRVLKPTRTTEGSRRCPRTYPQRRIWTGAVPAGGGPGLAFARYRTA